MIIKIMGKYQVDHFFHKAKKEGYLSRAVYKLIEIDKKYGLLKTGMKVLDLGAAPGSWMQWTANRVGHKGYVVGVDIQNINFELSNNATFVCGDITDPDFVEKLIKEYSPFDIVLSDMAPFTTGNKDTDSARSAMLAEQAFYVASNTLKSGGAFLVKIFQGRDFQHFLNVVKASFNRVRVIKPSASKKRSKETYILGLGFKS